MTLVLRYVARSDVGLVRGNNEDSVYAGARLLALADGMGGHAAGEVASELVISALRHLDDDEPGGDLLGKLGVAVRDGNTAIATHIEAEPELEGMGTTLTAILFDGDRLGMAHIGDSRAYLLRDGELNQITKDDTFVQTLVDEGRITAEEAHSHPQRSLIMRALTGHEVEPTLTMREARVGDRYLLCSDGLSDPVSDETIGETLRIPDIVKSADRLIELALRGGGPDNVTVVVAEVVDHDYGQSQPILAGAVSGEEAAPPTVPDTAAGRAAAFNPRRKVAKRIAPQADVLTHPPPSTSRRRMIIAAVLVLLLAASGLLVAQLVIRSNYYVAAGPDGRVSIMRGVPASILGYPLHRPAQWGCLDDRGEVLPISYGQAEDDLTCRPMTLQDLRPPAREQVASGLPTGTLDDALGQLRKLRDSLLPVCPAVQPQPNRAPKQNSTTPPVTKIPASTGAPGPAPQSGHPGPAQTTAAQPVTEPPSPAAQPEPGVSCRALP